MATPAQILANRDNAQRSTGPRTDEGKRAASRNAVRHGLTSSQLIMPGEDPAAYEELRQGMHESYRPATDPERFLVEQIAANSWRLMRAMRVESAYLSKLVEGADNPHAALALVMLERPSEVARIQRYVTAAQNAYYKAVKELTALQKQRAKEEEEAALFAMYMAQKEIGSVSQNHEPTAPMHEPAPALRHGNDGQENMRRLRTPVVDHLGSCPNLR